MVIQFGFSNRLNIINKFTKIQHICVFQEIFIDKIADIVYAIIKFVNFILYYAAGYLIPEFKNDSRAACPELIPLC
jgi:hypothetical protein